MSVTATAITVTLVMKDGNIPTEKKKINKYTQFLAENINNHKQNKVEEVSTNEKSQQTKSFLSVTLPYRLLCNLSVTERESFFL